MLLIKGSTLTINQNTTDDLQMKQFSPRAVRHFFVDNKGCEILVITYFFKSKLFETSISSKFSVVKR